MNSHQYVVALDLSIAFVENSVVFSKMIPMRWTVTDMLHSIVLYKSQVIVLCVNILAYKYMPNKL